MIILLLLLSTIMSNSYYQTIYEPLLILLSNHSLLFLVDKNCSWAWSTVNSSKHFIGGTNHWFLLKGSASQPFSEKSSRQIVLTGHYPLLHTVISHDLAVAITAKHPFLALSDQHLEAHIEYYQPLRTCNPRNIC